MQLQRLRVRDFRCLSQVGMAPAPGLNAITGDNASGKTSLLEAIHLLGHGQTFTGVAGDRLIREGASAFTVVGDLTDDRRNDHRIGVGRQKGETRFRLDGRDAPSRLALIEQLPIQVIDPNLHRLVESGPDQRRRYLDWGVFHVEHGFFEAWRRYRRALRQRNAALRRGADLASVVAWDRELVEAGNAVDACRRGYVDTLLPVLKQMVSDVLGEFELTLSYYAGWAAGEDFSSALIRGLDGDQRAGFTHAGPHRADLRIRVGHSRARDWVSRGQQKVISAAMLLAQAVLMMERRGVQPVLLIDDIAAELGDSYRRALLKRIADSGVQSFVTFLDSGLIPDGVVCGAMFHVEHGVVKARSETG
ncbi:MAG: DNA replication/repair protein RecF [Salinisphaeraceae bacterium]